MKGLKKETYNIIKKAIEKPNKIFKLMEKYKVKVDNKAVREAIVTYAEKLGYKIDEDIQDIKRYPYLWINETTGMLLGAMKGSMIDDSYQLIGVRKFLKYLEKYSPNKQPLFYTDDDIVYNEEKKPVYKGDQYWTVEKERLICCYQGTAYNYSGQDSESFWYFNSEKAAKDCARLQEAIKESGLEVGSKLKEGDINRWASEDDNNVFDEYWGNNEPEDFIGNREVEDFKILEGFNSEQEYEIINKKVKAVQWKGNNEKEVVRFAEKCPMVISCYKSPYGDYLVLNTSQGQHYLELNWWLIRREDGSFGFETNESFVNSYKVH